MISRRGLFGVAAGTAVVAATGIKAAEKPSEPPKVPFHKDAFSLVVPPATAEKPVWLKLGEGVYVPVWGNGA